tara:strand:+ start:273 stop:791 length:519 start_codon:yes stop_codon:yes gene_type:complete
MSTLKVNAITETDGSAFPFGKILQAEQEVKTGLSSTTSLSFVDLLSVSVTPSSTSSKFLLMYKVPMSTSVNGYSGMVRLVRDSTAIYIGDSYNSNTRASSQAVSVISNGSYIQRDLNGVFIDSPSTTSAITYKVQFRNDYSGYTVYVGRNIQGSTIDSYATTPHSFVVMEIG